MIHKLIPEQNEIQSRFVGIVVIGDVTHDDGIQFAHIGNFFVLPIFLKQIRHSVVAEKQMIQAG